MTKAVSRPADLRKIGLSIRHVREKTGLTQEELAEKADIHDRTLGRIERGEINLSITVFIKICKALKKTPNYLLHKFF